MSATEYARPGAEREVGLGFSHWPLVRRIALGVYLFALVLWSFRYGIPIQRELVILWTCGALICVSLGRPPREVLQIALDWLPIVAVLAAYDLTRGAADSLGIAVHAQEMIDFDRFVFFGVTPTEWLQARLYDPSVLSAWDVGFSIVYFSYFIVPFALAGVLWARDRIQFLRFSKRLVTLAFAGLATYVAFPAAPPWMAADQGLIGEVHRTSTEGFNSLGVATTGLISKGQEQVNLVAAVPSLHAAFTALVAMFLWGRVRPALRPVIALYPVLMGLTLIATGEHYFFDVLLGWLYAAAVMVAWAWWERRRGVAPEAG